MNIKKILSIAGSDSSGGAGIQADIKSITSLKHYAMSVITAITSQNTLGVDNIFSVPNDALSSQIDSVFSDIVPDAVKIGMIFDLDQSNIIKNKLYFYNAKNVVIDPVMVATSGDSLTSGKEVYENIFEIADIITPNIKEAENLLGYDIVDLDTQETAAIELSKRYDCHVVVKGGHNYFYNNSGTKKVCDIVCNKNNFKTNKFVFNFLENKNTHGTGCTFSSVLATKLAIDNTVEGAVRGASEYVHDAIKFNYNIGHGRGPLFHMYEFLDN